MDRDDALLCLERHATSKLTDMRDLESIGTLGFRGEALSSIASVSRFRLETATEDGAGVEIVVHNGRIQSVKEKGLPRGTSVQVERLFSSVPARRKFLRADSTELSHIARALTRFALAYPRVRFDLEHEGRRILETRSTEDPAERAAQIYGRDLAARLLPFDRTEEGVHVHGLAGRPADALPRRDGQHTFVNGRAVQDRTLSHAVSEAYINTMPRGRFAALVLFVDLEPAAVDVNVHPQKTEVRFRNQRQVHDFVRDTLVSAMAHEAAVPDLADLRPSPASAHREGVARAATRYLDLAERRPSAAESHRGHHRTWYGSAPSTSDTPRAPAVHETPSPSPGAEITEVSTDGETHRLVPLAQYRESYIIAQDGEGLVLVDQHAAHERVLFERFLADAEENRVEVQRLMFPLTIELAAHEALLLEEEIDEFRRLGFHLEPFGGNTVRLDGVPAVAKDLEPEGLLRELLGEASASRSAVAGAEQLRHRLVTTAACKAAIKINHSLTREGMQALLDDLFRTVSPTTCPHGRPLLFKLPLAEIERAFDRR
jgi:DNA mismatch repair protein MutL